MKIKNHGILKTLTKDSISPHKLELDQYQLINILACFHFNEIELEHECDLDPQLCDSILIFESMLTLVSLPNLDPFSKSTVILISIDFEIKLSLLDSYISLMGKECEIKFYDLNSNQNRLSNPKLIFLS